MKTYHLFLFDRLRGNKFYKSNIFITFVMKCSELIRILKRDGWYVSRQSGSHLILKHPTKNGHMVVPDHGSSEVGPGLLNKILKDAGLK
jgi:mRNA interferase HicA